MTDSEKIKAIEDMGIDWLGQCPDVDYSMPCKCSGPVTVRAFKECCPKCWIKALEDKP